MRSIARVTRAFLCGFLALSLASASADSHRLSSAGIQPWPVAVMPSAMNLESLSIANLVAWPVTCSAAAYTLQEGEKTNVLRALLGEDVEPLMVAGK